MDMQIKTWENLTVGEYQRIYDVNQRFTRKGQRDLNEVDANAEIISILAGVPMEEVDRLKLSEYQRILDHAAHILGDIPEAAPVKRVKLPGWGTFGIQYQVSDIDAGQYNEILSFSKVENGSIVNLHKILATLAFPVKRNRWGHWVAGPRDTKHHGEIAQAFQDVPFLTAYAAGVFFYLIFKGYWGTSRIYLQSQLKGKMPAARIQEVDRVMMDFSQISDGFMPPVKWPRLKISRWNRFGVYQLCNTLTDFNTLRQNQIGNEQKRKQPLNQP